MRSLVLLLLCVVLLAVLQFGAEAKKHNGKSADDKADDDKRWKHDQKRNKESRDKEITDVEAAAGDDHLSQGKQVSNDVMVGDQPLGEEPVRSDRRERVGKEDKKARRGKGRGEAKEQKKQAKAERQRIKQERKVAKAQRKSDKDNRPVKVPCTSEAQCQQGECCLPNRSGEMTCKSNRRPRGAGKKCLTTCTCDGDLQCYAANGPSSSSRRSSRPLGKCIASADADLTKGSFLTAVAAPTA